ncbi:MAG: thermonuclease family protein [Pseudobdellovibrionaceae bacterium]
MSLSPMALARAKKKNQIQNLRGLVQRCHDGDTCRVLVNNKSIKIRFSGIDSPEIMQPEGKMAKKFTESLILNKVVDLQCDGVSFDRLTCTVFYESKNINEEIVRNGFAWDSPKYSHGQYNLLMMEAQNKEIGIWKTTRVSPYCFRHKTSKKCYVSQLYME